MSNTKISSVNDHQREMEKKGKMGFPNIFHDMSNTNISSVHDHQ